MDAVSEKEKLSYRCVIALVRQEKWGILHRRRNFPRYEEPIYNGKGGGFIVYRIRLPRSNEKRKIYINSKRLCI